MNQLAISIAIPEIGFINFFNQLIESSKNNLQQEFGKIKALEHLQNWNYFPLQANEGNPSIQKPMARLDEAMQHTYYQPKIEQFNQLNNQSAQTGLTDPSSQPQINPNSQPQFNLPMAGASEVDNYLDEMFGT